MVGSPIDSVRPSRLTSYPCVPSWGRAAHRGLIVRRLLARRHGYAIVLEWSKIRRSRVVRMSAIERKPRLSTRDIHFKSMLLKHDQYPRKDRKKTSAYASAEAASPGGPQATETNQHAPVGSFLGAPLANQCVEGKAEVVYCISYGIYSVQYREAGVDAIRNRRSLSKVKLFGSLCRMSIKIRDSSSVAYRGEVEEPDRCPSV